MTLRVLLQYLFWRARKKKSLGFALVTGVLVVSLAGNAITFYIFDKPLNPDLTAFDCWWYSLISISTIGYGDLSAQSTGARIGTLVFIVFIGLASFTTFFGIVLDWFINLHTREQRGMCRVYEKGHILIVNFPSARRVGQVIDELARDERGGKRSVVIVTDSINELPFVQSGVSFVHGSPIEEETYEQANIAEAAEAIVLCTSSDDPNSDSVVASVVSIIEHLNPDLYTVAECLDRKHQRLFESTRCDSIVYSTRIVNSLLVHESQDKGVIKLVDMITTHQVGDTLFSLEVGDDGGAVDCISLAKTLLDHSVNLLCINRGRVSFTDFSSMTLEEGDVLVYVSKRRVTWSEVGKMLVSS